MPLPADGLTESQAHDPDAVHACVDAIENAVLPAAAVTACDVGDTDKAHPPGGVVPLCVNVIVADAVPQVSVIMQLRVDDVLA